MTSLRLCRFLISWMLVFLLGTEFFFLINWMFECLSIIRFDSFLSW
uniref:Uncharacterized protein n=1 Tax=Arundo donax TaxID=35708 RepID=A0A0A8Z550_ARUDO